MNPSTFSNPKNNPQKNRKHNKKRLTEDQQSLLESSFDPNRKLESERKHQLSRQLGIPPRQIAIWYQNKRARWKNQSLELDYNAVQLQLEVALAETRHLQKEIEGLRNELSKVQVQQAQEYNNNKNHHHHHHHPPLMVSSISSCGDEAGSSLQEDVNNCFSWNVNEEQVFKVEELYAACMMGADLALFGSKNTYL